MKLLSRDDDRDGTGMVGDLPTVQGFGAAALEVLGDTCGVFRSPFNRPRTSIFLPQPGAAFLHDQFEAPEGGPNFNGIQGSFMEDLAEPKPCV